MLIQSNVRPVYGSLNKIILHDGIKNYILKQNKNLKLEEYILVE